MPSSSSPNSSNPSTFTADPSSSVSPPSVKPFHQWTVDEHSRFLTALTLAHSLHDNPPLYFCLIARFVGNWKTVLQVRHHYDRYRRAQQLAMSSSGKDIDNGSHGVAEHNGSEMQTEAPLQCTQEMLNAAKLIGWAVNRSGQTENSDTPNPAAAAAAAAPLWKESDLESDIDQLRSLVESLLLCPGSTTAATAQEENFDRLYRFLLALFDTHNQVDLCHIYTHELQDRDRELLRVMLHHLSLTLAMHQFQLEPQLQRQNES